MRCGALLLLALLAAPALAQDRAATERRLAGLRDQVKSVEQQVRRTRGEETSALQALNGLDAEIQLRQELLGGYRTQIGTIRGETETLRRSIERLETEIEATKRSYRERARHAYMHGRRNSLALILAAGSVNQMIVRARYLQQFAQRRRQQVERIGEKTGELRSREQAVRQSLEETQRLLAQSQAEQTRLAQRRREREGLVVELRTRRGRLERELDQRRRDAAELEGLVRDLVAQERRRAEEERRRQEEAARAEAARVAAAQAEAARVAAAEEVARQAEVQRRADEAARRAREGQVRRAPEPRIAEPAAPPSPPVAEARPAERRPAAPAPRAEAPRPEARPAPEPPPPAVDRSESLTGSFRDNRGRLPWPVDGTVTGRFGNRTDPVYGTTISSPGIDISTRAGAPARSVFEGTVERVGTMATFGTYVIVSHGDFNTVYGNLSEIVVRGGQKVQAGQVVGRAGTADERRGTQLFFALFQGGQAVDPLGWLRAR